MSEKVKIRCPFCEKETIEALFTPAFFQAATSRSSASGSKTKFYKTKEKYDVQTGCSNCGKSQKEVAKAIREGRHGTRKEKQILERLKKQGILKDMIETKF